jgi:hypothetical protein
MTLWIVSVREPLEVCEDGETTVATWSFLTARCDLELPHRGARAAIEAVKASNPWPRHLSSAGLWSAVEAPEGHVASLGYVRSHALARDVKAHDARILKIRTSSTYGTVLRDASEKKTSTKE